MSKTEKHIKKYLGTKIFREVGENEFEVLRIIKIKEFNNRIIIKNENDETWDVTMDQLVKEKFTSLTPYGAIGFSIVKSYLNTEKTKSTKDIIVTLYRKIDLDLSKDAVIGRQIPPYAICRQGINDFFYNIISDKEDHNYVGVSVTRDNCPANIPYDIIAGCDEVLSFDLINIYRDDTIDSILECLSEKKYNDVMDELYKTHCEQLGPKGVIIYNTKEEHFGWCKNIRKLLDINNFIVDFNTMCEIMAVDFPIDEHIIDSETEKTLDEEMTIFLSETLKQNITKTMIIDYWYDIDLADFNNTSYTLLKDIHDNVYIVVYTTEGKYLEKDLEEKKLKLDISSRLRLSFYNKYVD